MKPDRGMAAVKELAPIFLGVITAVFTEEAVLPSRSCQCILSEVAL